MNRKISLFALVVFAIFLPVAHAAPQVGPLDVSGQIDGANYRIVVPAAWNGTLLVYAHGYRDKADHLGEVDNLNPDIAPNAALASLLLDQGFALSGTAFKDNGWAVEEGIHDVKNLVTHFRGAIAKPDRTILWAFSLGTVIAFETMERSAALFDGALCGCAVGSGATRTWDAAGDLALAYDVTFGTPPSWGTFADVRDDIDFETEVQTKLVPEVSNPANFPRFEFIRLVIGTPGRGIIPPPPPTFYPGWVFTDMFFVTEARAELERRAGGAVVQYRNRAYTITLAERAYLNGLGIPDGIIDGWLGAMNAQRFVAGPPHARNYLRRNANYTGNIKNPVLTMHTIVDPLVPVSQEFEYAETVANAGRSNLLFQTYTSGNGHCSFTGPQLVTAVHAIHQWVISGEPPTAATFPGALGFVPGFVPPPMNQP